MIKNNRQMAPTLSGIRDDHLERYRFARREINRRGIQTAIDVGCGCGYGSYVLAMDGGPSVTGYDIDTEAIKYGRQYYKLPNVHRFVSDLDQVYIPQGTALVMFEIIEHSRKAPGFLLRAARDARLLVLSVPNQNVVPFRGKNIHPEHYRHYTPAEIVQEVETAGWRVVSRGSQLGKHKDQARIIENDMRGRTLVVVAESEPK